MHLQFIREYSGKVDELIKDKLEAQKEVKSREQEEKDMVAQQVVNEVFSTLRASFLLVVDFPPN